MDCGFKNRKVRRCIGNKLTVGKVSTVGMYMDNRLTDRKVSR